MTERDRQIIEFYLAPHNLRETEAAFGLTFERIRQILIEHNIPRHKPYVRLKRDEPGCNQAPAR